MSHDHSEVWFLYLLNGDVNSHLPGLSWDFSIIYTKYLCFIKNDSIERAMEKSIRKHSFSKKQDQDGWGCPNRRDEGRHECEGILIPHSTAGLLCACLMSGKEG